MTDRIYSALKIIVRKELSQFLKEDLRILILTALPTTVLFKVVDKGFRMVPQIAKVNGLTTLAQKQQAIKDFEQFSRWLMDPREELNQLLLYKVDVKIVKLTCKE